MTTAETVRRLLIDAAGEALCDACLALACSVGLLELREITTELLDSPSFQRSDQCVSCRRTTPAIAYTPKCTHCSRAMFPGEKTFEANGDILHAACYTRLCADATIRISQKLSQQSRRLIEDARRKLR